MNSEVSTEAKVERFLDAQLLAKPVAGVFQVGSSARGYALDDSDIDLMAFYEGEEFESFPKHTTFEGVRFTLEHHHLNLFIRQNGDFAVNPGSLRQMCKIRDGKLVVGDVAQVATLRSITENVSLSRRPLLYLLYRLVNEVEEVRTLSEPYQQQFLTSSTELVSTLMIMTLKNGPAYSKPKWLIRNLKDAAISEPISLLQKYGGPSDTASNATRIRAISDLYSSCQSAGIDDKYALMLETAVRDAIQIADHRGQEAGPALRFAAIQIWRATRRSNPLEILRTGEELPPLFSTAMGVRPISQSDECWHSFERFLHDVFSRVVQSDDAESPSRIGTRRFMTHLFAAYEANDVFPYISDIPYQLWTKRLKEAR